MRVKTVPRQRIVQSNAHATSGMCELNLEHLQDSSTSDEETSNESKHTAEALGVPGKCKCQPLHTNLLSRYSMAGPSKGKYAEPPSVRDTARISNNDGNNNVVASNIDTNLINSNLIPSTSKYLCHLSQEHAMDVSANEDITKAINLSKKSCQPAEQVEEHSLYTNSTPDDNFKGTYLYKIMTDPTFLENIKRNKQSKKYVCQFCKQEFINGDELANHMDVKKNESNQVMCCACKQTFAQKRYLRYHQRCHSERTKYTCDICTKKFTRLDNLTRHNTFHVNPDKFSCTSCEKTFARKDLLNKHQKCHDNKYRFFCETCQKYFKGPLTLENHKKIFHSTA